MTNPQLPNPNFTLAAPLQQVDRTYVRFGRTRLSYFGGCDYFRLSTQPALRRALLTGLKKFGLTVAASRSTTGNHEIYERLESRLAQFFDAPAAVLLSSGYLGNLALAQALAGTFSPALIVPPPPSQAWPFPLFPSLPGNQIPPTAPPPPRPAPPPASAPPPSR